MEANAQAEHEKSYIHDNLRRLLFDNNKVAEWLNTPQIKLSGEKPMILMETAQGRLRVQRVIDAMLSELQE